ncbi:MAG: peptide deformylase [Candidatus Yanofskybacteria bacterium RIFCSPLOWO2_01_FULL_41_34]|uniref:Peptide deformylase n=1 Tax=Candidatus Yanofskybacteria bacterium RIFCSPHIGHO2_01_FULL_41_26 TaxID=1802661 RepID=A0A1F8ECA2_9BACT|nr:MAG: peptide deformylase [Candidatus Yanofskybacteria bacterium RIFCSPHIGHO2_01_FULL_41_26]OGN22974.1 MAG: peptide deformylase [Candidatus Yanofskybacteria bacterium RIFCSPLOWO2_01_FULL_41_34]
MEIIKIPNKILAKTTDKIDIEDIKNGSFKELVLEMKKAMKDNVGIGLAANQINKDLSIFIIEAKLASENNIPEVFFNPEITEYSKNKDEMEEGCLSIPEYEANIKRSKKIKIKAIDESGNKIKLKARGFLARVLQHETDHLNGKTIKDRANGK